jgi:hypothetical protein
MTQLGSGGFTSLGLYTYLEIPAMDVMMDDGGGTLIIMTNSLLRHHVLLSYSIVQERRLYSFRGALLFTSGDLVDEIIIT